MDANELVKRPPTTKQELLEIYIHFKGELHQYARMARYMLLAKVVKGMQKNGISWIRPGDHVLAIQGGRDTVFTWRPCHPQFRLDGRERSDWEYWKNRETRKEPVGNISANKTHIQFIEPLLPTKTIERDGKQIEVFDMGPAAPTCTTTRKT